MEIDLTRFRETFFQEATEHLSAMENGLLSLQSGAGDGETLHCIFRGAHSLKAGANMFGCEAMGRFTHVLENLLDRLRNGETQVSAPLVELLLRSVDVLRELLAAAQGQAEPTTAWEDLVENLDRARSSGAAAPASEKPEPEASSATRQYAIHFVPGPEIFRMGLDPLLALRDLAALGHLEAEPDLARLPALAALEVETCHLGWRLRLTTSADGAAIRDVFAFLEDVSQLSIEAEAPAQSNAAVGSVAAPLKTTLRSAAREASIRVATDKVDRLIDLVGELVIAQSMAAEVMHGFTPDQLPRLEAAMTDLDRYTRELQERAMRIRMMPVGNIFNRFPRLVHDTALALGKKVAIEVSGEETELDKGVVESIADPLTHLVRNAVDHGIESPEERQAAGKPEEGRLRLCAWHQGGNVIVEVADDGRGLDTKRIWAKGVARGLIGADEDLTDEQVHALIFRPGFSTAERVTDLSGRGVGMDVVKKSVEGLNGNVSLRSEAGKGSAVRIKLPLTLAILDGMLLRVGSQTYVLPLVSIVESIRPRPEQVHRVAGKGEVVEVRRQALPLMRLGDVFHLASEFTDPSRGLVMIVEHEGRQLALLVDELLGQHQVVVKSLETNFRKVEGITGATILGDGRAALILDVAGVAAMCRQETLTPVV